MNFTSIPIVDLQAFNSAVDRAHHALNLRSICKTSGFFYVVNHGVPLQLQNDLKSLAKKFFELPEAEKQAIHMNKGGTAWRGYFKVGEELTSSKIDLKEGLYLGEELLETHPKVLNKTPLHGKNLFPESLPELKTVVLEWLDRMQQLGKTLLRAIAQSLGLETDYFEKQFQNQFLSLFRIFHYPADFQADSWGVGEHTDYGLLTILMVTDKGLEVKNRQDEWIKADPIEDSFIINIGDMLERMTKGLYKSTPHRVKNSNGASRYSFPFFYDPGWPAQVQSIPFEITEQELSLLESA